MNSVRLAALPGHGKVLGSMLQSNKDCDINESDSAGRTALIWASQVGHENVVLILVDGGADIDALRGVYGNALRVALGGAPGGIARKRRM